MNTEIVRQGFAGLVWLQSVFALIALLGMISFIEKPITDKMVRPLLGVSLLTVVAVTWAVIANLLLLTPLQLGSIAGQVFAYTSPTPSLAAGILLGIEFNELRSKKKQKEK